MKVTVIHTGYFKLDGGAMFGVVPKRMWEKLNPPDAQNLCTWSMRTLLVEIGDRKILIDTGIGNKQDERFRSHFLPFGEETLFGSLAQAGITREAVTDVFLTHLHFDHCGGALWKNEKGEIELAFPNATYWSNEPHWHWVTHPNAREKASFLTENFVPLLELERIQFVPVEQGVELFPGFRVEFFYGHTEALMAPVLDTPQGKLMFCADALPAQWHIPMPYVMAYDIRPLVTLEEKEKMLETAIIEERTLFLEHDPVAECATVKFDEKGRIVADYVGELKQGI